MLPVPGEMVFVRTGKFPMGCDPAYSGGYSCASAELPLHTVYLDPYRIDRTEVANAQYAQYVMAGACTLPGSTASKTRPSYYSKPTHTDYPVIRVDWYLVSSSCAWAGERLPLPTHLIPLGTGRATYYSHGVFDTVLRNRAIAVDADVIGFAALLNAEHIGRRVWITWPDGTRDGPYLVADCAKANHRAGLFARGWIVDVDHGTAMLHEMRGPITVTVLVEIQ